MATAASISSPDLWGEATGDRGRNVLLGGLLFLLVNYGLRLPPVASWALRMMGKDPKHLDKQSKYATLHGVATRATGALHNLFAVPACLYVLLFMPDLRSDPCYTGSVLSNHLAGFSASYFLHDIANVVLNFKEEGAGYLIHGVCCSGLYTYIYFTGWGEWFGAAFLTWEMSTPFVHLRWFLYTMGLKDSKLYMCNGLCMVASFFLARNVLGLYMSYVYWETSGQQLENPRPGGVPAPVIWLFRIANVLLNALNLFWLHKMLAKALSFLSSPKEE
mmetsp:Transcript_23712/g.59786  ORF Transcript_23712/g.59786 Transcript_23712/m.59786 type:complete len:275 (-) Transcript_23712:135-959(-)|eukprot:jgi/Tetstr1/463422/TSEL_000726.t1